MKKIIFSQLLLCDLSSTIQYKKITKSNVMKRVFFPLMILFINTTISCKKEVLTSNEVSESSLSATSQENISSDDSAGTTLFGVLPSGLQNESRISVAEALNVKYIRKSIDVTRF